MRSLLNICLEKICCTCYIPVMPKSQNEQKDYKHGIKVEKLKKRKIKKVDLLRRIELLEAKVLSSTLIQITEPQKID